MALASGAGGMQIVSGTFSVSHRPVGQLIFARRLARTYAVSGKSPMRSPSPDQCRYVLVLYLKRPPRNSRQSHDLGRALRIQRLEGSRPEGRLCSLNGAERVQMFK